MKIGLPKEIKDNEYRVGLTPAGVNALVNAGHEVFVQKTAGDELVVAADDDAHPRVGAKAADEFGHNAQNVKRWPSLSRLTPR